MSEGSLGGPGCAGKTKLGASVVVPVQVHTLHSPPLTLMSPSVFALIENECLHEQTPSTRREQWRVVHTQKEGG